MKVISVWHMKDLRKQLSRLDNSLLTFIGTVVFRVQRSDKDVQSHVMLSKLNTWSWR